MPTFTKLFALLLFGALAYSGTQTYMSFFDPPRPVGTAGVIMAVIGALVGWQFLGKRVAGNLVMSAWNGVQTVILIVLWGLLIFGIIEVFQRGYQRQFDGITEAVLGVFSSASNHLIRMNNIEFIGLLAVFGAVGGILARLIYVFAEKRRR
jgi:hypothetical protein